VLRKQGKEELGMRKGKQIAAVLMASAMAASLTACGSASSSSSASSAASSATASSAKSESSAAATETVSGSSAAGTSAATGGELQATAKVDPDKQYNISVIFKTLSSEHWQVMKAGVDAYTKLYPNITADPVGPSAETMYDEQLNSITTAVDSDSYDAYIIAPLQSDSAAKLYATTSKPVVAVDTNMSMDSLATFVGTGNEEAAKEGATKAVEMARELGWEEINCIEIAGVQGDETNTARMNGYKAGINENGGTFLEDEIQYANAVADQAVTAMEAIMSKHPDGVAIICANNDDMALAAAKTAAGNEAFKNTVFLGFDGSSAVCNSIATGEVSNFITIAQNPYEMGFYAVDNAIKAINGEKLDKFVNSGVTIITKDNAQERYDTVQGYLKG
jgi:ABC-type sugar transport system substrate-binding protein